MKTKNLQAGQIVRAEIEGIVVKSYVGAASPDQALVYFQECNASMILRVKDLKRKRQE